MDKIKQLIKESKFWKIYFCSIGVFVCLLIIGLIVFSVWLSDYQSSQNTVEVDRVLSMFEQGKYDEILAKTDVVMTGFVSKDEYEAKLKTAIEGKKLTYVKTFSYNRFESPAYIIKADGENLCKVTLKESSETSTFGFSLYEFDYISEFSFADINIVVLAPEGTTAYIDGKEVDSVFRKILAKDQKTDTKYALGGKSTEIHRYEVCGLLNEPETVEVKTKSGDVLALKQNSNNEIVADLLDVTVHVPAGFTVTVNGTVLDNSYMSGQPQENQFIKYMLNDSDKESMSLFNTYEIRQLADKPNVTVKDSSGNNVECTYNAKTQTFEVGFKVFTLHVPSNYTLTVNGKDITASQTWLVEANVVLEELSNIPDSYFTKPYMNTYKVAVLSGNITVDAKNYKGETVPLSYDENSMTFTGNFDVAEGSKSEYIDVAIAGAKKYAGFMSNDISKSSFLSGIISGTQMYKDMSEYRQYWYTDHDSTAFENVEAYDLRVYGEDCFSCAVYFDYWIYGQRGKPDFEEKLETNTRIWYVKRGSTWYMSDIEIFERK